MKNQNNLDSKYLDKIKNIKFKPVFIMGLHRSGTSILYKLLGETKKFNVVNAYHMVYYDQLLYNHENNLEEKFKQQLNQKLQQKNNEDRGIDKLKVYADLPEEYVFIITRKTLLRYINPLNKDIFIEMCKKIQYISENNKKPLILKNPYDFPNFLYIKKIFPDAKFIFIHRHPLKIISSTLKAEASLYKKLNQYYSQMDNNYVKIFKIPLLHKIIYLLYSKLGVLGTIQITNYSKKAVNYYFKNIDKISEEDYVIIKYEDLCENPNQIMENILHFLGFKEKNNIDFRKYISPRKLQLDPTIIKLKNFIYKSMKKYFDFLGYELDE